MATHEEIEAAACILTGYVCGQSLCSARLGWKDEGLHCPCRQAATAALAAAERVREERKLPCDVLVAPATVIRAGCAETTVLTAIDQRRKWAEQSPPIRGQLLIDLARREGFIAGRDAAAALAKEVADEFKNATDGYSIEGRLTGLEIATQIRALEPPK